MAEVAPVAAGSARSGVEAPVFGDISRGEWEYRRLLDALREIGAAPIRRSFAPGEEIYRAGEGGGALYVLTRGRYGGAATGV